MRRTKESKGSSAKRTATRDELDRPFEDGVWRKAVVLAAQYRLILDATEEGGYVGSAIELPTVLAEGKTADECVESTKRALAVAAATMIEAGHRPPVPARRGRRQVQINVRLTPDEKFILEDAARRLGFKGISDFVRAVALERSTAA